MERNFITRKENDDHDAIVDAVAGRENELASYDTNIAAYTQQLIDMDTALPPTWVGLERYEGKSAEQIFLIGGTSEEQLLASKLNHRTRVRLLLFTEQVERNKSEVAYAHCKSMLPTDDQKLTDALIRYEMKKAARKQ